MLFRSAEYLALEELEDFPPRYNIAPTQPILIVANSNVPQKGDNRSGRKAGLARWGLIPGWVKDMKSFPLLLNARSETAAEKNSFRAALRHRRVLIPASGFYEWQRTAGKKSQPYWVKPRTGSLVAFAGLMETWMSADGSEIDTAAIITAAANDAFAAIHDRMPVVIQPQDFSRWLDCINAEPRQVADLLNAPPEDFLDAIPISDKVNKVANTGPDLHNPVNFSKPVERVVTTPEEAPPPTGQMKFF